MTSLIFEAARDTWTAMRSDYLDELDRRIREADEDCIGHLVNKKGRAAGLSGPDLFKGPVDRAYRYATFELIEHWGKRGRLSLAQFEAEWLLTRGGLEALAASAAGGQA